MKRKILALTLCFAMVMSILPTGVFAAETQSGTCGENVTWTLDDTGTLTISGTGDMTDYSSSSESPWYDVRKSIKSVIIESGITSIGNRSFWGCSNVDSAVLPDGVTDIGESAFMGCGFSEIIIPDSVMSIGQGAIASCQKLVSVTIPSSVSSIGSYAFRNCTSLVDINVDEENSEYCSVDGVLFSKDKTVLVCYPAGKPESVYTIPEGVTAVADYAFAYNTSLMNITVPSGVETIGVGSFEDCLCLTEITIPDSVTEIGSYAFRNCTSLVDINVDEENTEYCSVDGVLFSKNKTELICYPAGKEEETYEVPSCVSRIGGTAFAYNTNLTEVMLPSGVSYIGSTAFADCTWLRKITIPSGVKTIGAYAFRNCKNLTIYGTMGSYAETYANENSIAFSMVDFAELAGVEVIAPEMLHIGCSEKLQVNAIDINGKTVSVEKLGDAHVLFESSDPSIAEVDENGTVKAISVGTVEICVRVMLNGMECESWVSIWIDDSDFAAVQLSAPYQIYVGYSGNVKIEAFFESGASVPLDEAEILFSSTNSEIATVDENGVVTGINAGIAEICAEVTYAGVTRISAVTIEVLSRSSKSEPTYYTYEKIANARENIAIYDWAAAIADEAVAKADKLVELGADVLYNMIPAPGIPRSIRIGLKNDANFGCCRYCGKNISAYYGQYGWVINPTTRPWKVQCPECKRLFPSNDFESFYELGLDQQGDFDRMMALQRHHEILFHEDGSACDCTAPTEEWSEQWKAYYGYGEGYLRNELYTELYNGGEDVINCGQGLRPTESGATWGVDDGYGYNTGVVSADGIKEVHTYIPYYTCAVWSSTVNKNYSIADNLEALANAYIYTGDMRYGRLGAIMLDRIADIYPAMDVSLYGKDYYTTDGNSGLGKILGRIWDCNLAKTFALAYDAFFPIYDDPQVIDYLHNKALMFNLENEKISPEQIRANAENGILREIYKAVKAGQINGNFGMLQSALAAAAVVLDSEPETSEMLDWIMRTGVDNYRNGTNTGGNVFTQLVDNVDRNGMGNEASPGYNAIWPANILPIAEILAGYENGWAYDLFQHPKFIEMFTAHIPLVLAETHHAQIGDSGSTAGMKLVDGMDTYISGFKHLKDPKLAQYIYLRNGNTTDGLRYGIFARDPERLADEVSMIIEEYGELPNKSEMMSGYGFAVLRGGEKLSAKENTLRDFWMYFGATAPGHAHNDALNLGMEAYGLNVAPDLGYPETTGMNANRYQWSSATISHNTVVVDGENQADLSAAATPLHFDDAGAVKVMDVDASAAYSQAENYRRTVVMIEAPDGNVSYGIDFFRVTGGDSHTYSFHSQAANAETIEGIELIPQVDETGNYVGTYAGPDVPFGQDPNTQDLWSYETKYPRGYTWMKNVRRSVAAEEQFTVDFDIEDYNKAIEDTGDIHLRLTQLNDFTPSEVAIVGGPVPKTSNNQNLPETLDYLLVQREGENLDTLFTSVIEPYKDERYIESIENVEISGDTSDGNVAKAVKVRHTSGRTDYIVYATDNTVTYRLDDLFDFRGFVGVYSVNEYGEVIYSYINDGDILGDQWIEKASYTGTVTNFTDELSYENYITVELDGEIYGELLNNLAGRYVYVENDGVENGAYKILSACEDWDGNVQLEVDTTHVRSYVDSYDFSKGYTYNIAEGQNVVIPMSYSEDYSPVFYPIYDQKALVGNQMAVAIQAESPVGAYLTYTADLLPYGAELDCETGIMTWTPDASQLGEHVVKIGAYDDAGRYSYITFKIFVDECSVGGITIDKTALELNIGETETITATIKPPEAGNKNVRWSSSDASVAEVVDGVVTAKGAGTAIIFAIAADGGYTASCVVTVLPSQVSGGGGSGGGGEFIPGDVNADGSVDFVDAILVLKHDAELALLSGDALLAADANADGYADFADAILILKYDAGLISSFK